MSCLDDIINSDRVIIGVRDFKDCSNPEARLYINDLPGMSLKLAAQITPEQFQSGAEFLRSCNIMAVRQVFDEFAQELQPYFNFANIIETRDLKIFSTTLNAVSATERGIIVKRWRSEAARLYVENVYIKVAQAGTATIKIIDGAVETTTEVNLVEGLNEIRLDYKASEEQIRIVFDQAAFETYDGAWNKSSGGCSSCGGSSSGKGIFVSGWDGTGETSNTYGVGVKVHAQCYEEEILCSLLSKMYFLIWYKSGILVLREHIATNRINHMATFGTDRAKELKEEYENEYQSKYNILVKSAYQHLRSTKGECVKCSGLRYAQATP